MRNVAIELRPFTNFEFAQTSDPQASTTALGPSHDLYDQRVSLVVPISMKIHASQRRRAVIDLLVDVSEIDNQQPFGGDDD